MPCTFRGRFRHLRGFNSQRHIELPSCEIVSEIYRSLVLVAPRAISSEPLDRGETLGLIMVFLPI
jgi:hypothetical protein